MRFVAAPLVLALCTAAASAQTVTLSGSMGDKALLIINGMPRTVAAGASFQNVKVVSVAANEAIVEMDGKHIRLQLGGAPVNLGRASGGESGTQIVMTAGPGGHFTSGGTINGKSVRFLVDTGATLVSMSEADADRIGLKYRDGERGHANTANGSIEVHRVKLDVIRIGDVQVYNVEALVGPMPMENILLGNSFLGRFQMKRENDRLTLDRRL